MKKILMLVAIFALVFTNCEDSTTEDNKPKLPNLTIRNESSYVLTDVKFSGISFAASGNDLPTSSQSVKQLTANDVNKPGFITFTRKDIGIALRTDAISIGTEDDTFTFTDNTPVEEQANSGNKNSLSQISFLSKVTVELSGLSVPKNDIVDIEEFVGFTKQTEFTLKNTGVGKLLLTGTQPVKITGTRADAFSVIQPASSEIAPNNSLTFKINFSPGEIQDYSATVTINSNDRDGDFTFTMRARGVPPKPIATVLYENNEIAQNGTINAGEVLITLSKSITVVIKNTGADVLTLDTANITITGADAEAFIKTTNPGGSISIGGQTSFIIECKPTKQGENNAVLTIPTNDNSRNPVVVYLKVTGVKGSAVLELKQGNTVIGNNSLTPFDFGRVEIGTVKNLSFMIINTGNIALNLSETSLITSTNTAFEILSQPVTKTLIPGASVSFNVRFTPIAEAEAAAFIDIPNDSDEGLFTLNVTGTGYVKRPQITVKQDDVTIEPHGEYDFGSILISKTSEVTFTIMNSGEANLTFVTVNGNRINLAENNAGLFNVTLQPSTNTSVAPGSTTTFTIRFSPITIGTNLNAIVQIETNSWDNDEFFFRVKGNGRNYIIGDTGPGGGLIFFAQGNQYKECSGELGSSSWKDAVTTAETFTGGSFSNWHLPDRGELSLMYQNLALENLGGFYKERYWSLEENNWAWKYYFDFSNGSSGMSNQDNVSGDGRLYRIRAVRSFSLQ